MLLNAFQEHKKLPINIHIYDVLGTILHPLPLDCPPVPRLPASQEARGLKLQAPDARKLQAPDPPFASR